VGKRWHAESMMHWQYAFDWLLFESLLAQGERLLILKFILI
jgi:hypothetical protein